MSERPDRSGEPGDPSGSLSPGDENPEGVTRPEPGVVRGSGDAAVASAQQRAETTAGRNIPTFSDLPVAEDTANLRFGPDLHSGLLALLPLVGVWEGEGEGENETYGQHRFGQQIIVAHDGENYLSWTSRGWIIGGADSADAPAYRESGFWRISEDDKIEFLVAHASGHIEMYYGEPVQQAAWEVSTDVVLASPTGGQSSAAKRLYGIVPDGDLGWVEERMHPEHGLRPHLSARLSRVAG